MEVFYKGQWGTICDNLWDMNDAKVVCRQLGYQYEVRAFQEGNIRPGSGKIWLDYVRCTGDEQNLTSCSHAGWGNHNCGHSQDAGVECSTGKIDIKFSSLSCVTRTVKKHGGYCVYTFYHNTLS